ncbi:MAG TPA: hypothetical protein VFX19_05265, partial [Dehalococcoidia bacterium]|nr:hypothetical protein [Dehalococcoidia bacterium]
MAVYLTSSRLSGLVPPLPVQLVLAGVAAAAIFGSQFIGGATSSSGNNPNSSLGSATDAMIETGAPALTFSNQSADFGPSVNDLLKLYPVVDESPVQDESSMQNDAVSAVLSSQPEAEQAPVAEVAPAVQQSAPVTTVSTET